MAGETDADGDRVQVMIVDDHALVGESLAAMLDREPDLHCVAVAATLEQARALIPVRRPDVLVLDHDLPDGRGVDAIAELRSLWSPMQVLVLTASADGSLLARAIESGAAGFVSKRSGLAELVSAARLVAAGECVASPDMLERLLPALRRRDGVGQEVSLTERERQILALVAEGLSNAAIAERLVVSVFTVRNHIARLSAKLGAHSKLEVLAIATRRGLVDPADRR